jgi:hypothetical protein
MYKFGTGTSGMHFPLSSFCSYIFEPYFEGMEFTDTNTCLVIMLTVVSLSMSLSTNNGDLCTQMSVN